MTPQKVYDKGDYRRAIKMATSDVLRNKDVAANKAIIKRAVRQMANARVEQHDDIMARDVGVWKKSQRQYYRDLELVGKVHKSGIVDLLPAYDAICDRKMELDFAIVEYYYLGADSLLNVAHDTGHKASARQAYSYLRQCQDADGERYFSNIPELMDEAVDRGTVYFVADGVSPSTGLFLQPLPRDVDIEPDCRVSADVGFMDTDVSQSTSSRTYTKEVVDHILTTRDTSGMSVSTEVMKQISATVEVTTYEIEVTQRVTMDVQHLTDHCSMSSDWETISRSETLEEVSITGDNEALPIGVRAQSVNVFSTQSQLESDVRSAVRSWLGN
jgi:hypothetical protein